MSHLSHPGDPTLMAFAADELEPPEVDEVAEHLGECELCQETLAGLEAVLETAREVHRFPSDLARRRGRARLDAALRAEALQSRRGLRGGRLVAVAAVAAFSGAALAITASGALSFDPLRSEPGRAGAAPPAAGAQAILPRATDVAPPAAEEPTPAPVATAATGPAATPAPKKRPARSAPPSSPGEEARGADPADPRPPVEASSEAEPEAGDRELGGAADELAAPPARQPEQTEPVRVARAEGTPTSAEALARAQRALDGASPGAPGWADLGELAAFAGEPEQAADAYVQALAGPEAGRAAERLEKLARAGAPSPAALAGKIEALPEAAQSGEGLRLLCAWGLQHRGDRAAVAVCQTFGRRFPDHPSVRVLALSAGRTAEQKLGDLRLAEEEYSRALLVSQYAGLPGTSALFARARVRSKLDDREEARADLRLFLHVQPEARWRQDVAELAHELDVPLPPR